MTLLEAAGLERLPFQSCSSVLTLDESARRIAVAFKDRGERRLCETMADMMSQLANPSWIEEIDAVAYIPDTAAAFRRRGFDHGQLLGCAVAQRLKKPCHGLLGRPTNVDQRMLGRRERLANMSSAFGVNPEAAGRMPSNVLLVDDVITTGATLYAASIKLLESGVSNVRCITYARVW